MKRQQTMAAVMVAVLLVLALVVVLMETSRPAAEPAAQRVWDLQPGQVGALSARGTDGISYSMQKDALGTWHLVEPALGQADQSRLNWLVEDLAHLESVRQFAAGEIVPAEAGLEPPAFTLVVGLRGGGEHVLEVGNLAPTGFYYYTRVDGVVHLCAYDVVERVMRLVTTPPLATVPALWPTEAAP